MNSTIYIFGNMQNGYTQYPDDETTHEIFRNFALNAKAPTQLAVHRDGSLMYYGYIRKLQGEQYIGLCILLNSRVFANVPSLFSLFEQTIEKLAELGYLIKFDMQGNLITNTQHLYMSTDEVGYVADYIRKKTDGQLTVPIPPVDYSVPSDSVRTFTVNDATGNILNSAHTHGYTYVYKLEGYNTATMDSYQGVLAAVNDENENLKLQIEILKGASTPSHVDKAGSSEKNWLRGVVIVFAIILIGVGVFAYQQVKDNEEKQEQINQTQELLTNFETQPQHTKRNMQTAQREPEVRENRTTVAPATAGLLQGYVKDEDGYTNVRQGPGTNYEIVTTIKDGSSIFYTVYNSKWNIVYDNYGNALGYMYHNKIVTTNTRNYSTESILLGYIKDEDGYTNVRQGPGTDYSIVYQIQDGSPIYYQAYNAKWYKVYDNEQNFLGYMHYSKIIP